MARVSNDEKALTDPRFVALARHAGLANRWEALGRCNPIWNQCQEQETYELSRDTILDIHPDVPSFYDALLQSGLAREEGDPGVAYICGTFGRIEWLARKRRAARENGAKGGRPAKRTNLETHAETYIGSAENQSSFRKESAPAPAPAPAPVPAKGKGGRATRVPDPFEVTTELREWAASNYPQVDLNEQTPAFVRYWSSVAGQKGLKLDWSRTWQNDVQACADLGKFKSKNRDGRASLDRGNGGKNAAIDFFAGR